MGNFGVGMDVSQSRNSSWHSAALSAAASRFCSMRPSHDTARWQFCRQTHVPPSMALAMASCAMGPWPWPRGLVPRAVLCHSLAPGPPYVSILCIHVCPYVHRCVQMHPNTVRSLETKDRSRDKGSLSRQRFPLETKLRSEDQSSQRKTNTRSLDRCRFCCCFYRVL